MIKCNGKNRPVSLFDLTGKAAVVTGSSRGIGRAIVERMAEHGARIVVSSRHVEPCREVAAAINARLGEGRAVAIAANISANEQLQALVKETVRAFGQIDVLVCNAASNPHYGPMADITDEQFRKILDNNVLANHRLITMVARPAGGLDHSRLFGRRNEGKPGDRHAFARNLAVEFGPHNVRVNCIAAGLVRTDFARALWENPEMLKRSTARTPLGRIGEPDEIAGAAILLASRAGSFMTGQIVVVDGGATIT